MSAPPSAPPPRQSRLIAVAVIAVVASIGMLLAYDSLDESPRLWFLGRMLYWLMPLVLLMAVAAALWRLPPRQWSRAWLARQWPLLLVALGVTVACAALIPAEMRVQWDETNLLSTSRSMHDVRAAFVATQAAPQQGAPQVLEYMVDKRPPLFAFLVSLLHDLTGFRVDNAFACNLVALFGLLAMVGTAVRDRFDQRTGAAAVMLLASVPLAIASARSAGFELLAATLLTATLLATLDFTRAPSTTRLVWLMTIGLLFSYTRYESAAVFSLLLSYTLWVTRGQWAWPPVATLLSLFAAFATPVALQYLHATDRDFYSESAQNSLISVSHAIDHLPGLLRELFDPSLNAAFPGVLSWLTATATMVLLFRRQWTRAHGIVALPVLTATAIALLWFYGDATEPSAQRLYLPIALLAALGPVLWRQIAARAVPAWALLTLAVLLFGWRLHELRDGRAFPRLQAASGAIAVDSVLPQLLPHRRDSLIICTIAQYLVMQGYGAVSADGFERHRASLRHLRQSGEIRDVFFLETPIDPYQAQRFGSVREMLQRTRHELHVFEDGDVPIAVYRMTGGWPF